MFLASIIVRYPYVILIAVTVFSSTCLIIPLTLKKIPEFEDPQLGFETRGTVIAQRLTAWHNLLKAATPSGQFVVNPKEIFPTTEFPINNKQNKKKSKNKTIDPTPTLIVAKQINYTDNSHKKPDAIDELRRVINHDHDHEHLSKDGYFCGTPDERYARFVVRTTNNETLFSFKSFRAMCEIEYQLAQLKSYHSLCMNITHNRCCHPWSLVNYIALLHNRTSCLGISEEDVSSTLAMLQSCSKYYHRVQLIYDCSEKVNCQIPPECGRHNAVYYILHYLTDIEFMPVNGSNNTFLKESVMFLPVGCSTKTIDFYHELEHKSLNHENVQLIAMEFGLKNALFDEYLIRDTWLVGCGGLCVLFCMWLYTESVFLTFMTITAIVFSLAISYFLYTLVFEYEFFPFMNLLTSVVAVGIGADDTFIFCKVWQSHKVERYSSVLRMVTETYSHAFMSMFVTSLTTAAAFYTSLMSSITAVRCFGAFAGTAVVANFALMITWLPACLVVSERWNCCSLISPRWKAWGDKLRAMRQTVDHVWAFLEKCLLMLTLRFRYVWICLFSCAALVSVLVVLRFPGLQLPDYPEFQLFKSSHPFEQYDLYYKQKFWFEKMDNSIGGNYKLPLRFVWGILPIDNGDYKNPSSKGTMEIDNTFDMAAPESQKWLLGFCRQLRAQPFYMSTLGPLLPNCFIESFVSWMQRRCNDFIDNIDRKTCCEVEKFPYERHVFQKCIVEAMLDLYETPTELFIPGIAGPKFSRSQYPATIQAIVVEYDSNYSYSMSFTYMDKFYQQIEKWMQDQLKTAPPGMKNGWFISDLEFYDLQRVISSNTILAIGIAMIISFAVLLFVTLNILISVYAIITISCSIFSTIAILVLLGWKLNVLESIAVSTAVGLAVDFSIHYGVNYRMMSLDSDRRSATRSALMNMGGPTAMTALTTAIAGALMLSSTVLAYIQIGMFLVVVMAVSWLYSTFLFCAILSIAGPENGFGQFRYPLIKYCFQKHDLEPDTSSADSRFRTNDIYNNVICETTFTTTSIICDVPNTESHELELLTDKSGPSTSGTQPRLQSSDSAQVQMHKSNTQQYFEAGACHFGTGNDDVIIDEN